MVARSLRARRICSRPGRGSSRYYKWGGVNATLGKIRTGNVVLGGRTPHNSVHFSQELGDLWDNQIAAVKACTVVKTGQGEIGHVGDLVNPIF